MSFEVHLQLNCKLPSSSSVLCTEISRRLTPEETTFQDKFRVRFPSLVGMAEWKNI